MAEISLPVFQGPLDLLLHLIERDDGRYPSPGTLDYINTCAMLLLAFNERWPSMN